MFIDIDMELNTRLTAFIKAINTKVARVEIDCGFSNGSLSTALKENRAIGSDRLEIIFEKYPRLNVEWLMTGRGDMFYPNGPLVESLQKVISVQDILIAELRSQLDDCKKKNAALTK